MERLQGIFENNQVLRKLAIIGFIETASLSMSQETQANGLENIIDDELNDKKQAHEMLDNLKNKYEDTRNMSVDAFTNLMLNNINERIEGEIKNNDLPPNLQIDFKNDLEIENVYNTRVSTILDQYGSGENKSIHDKKAIGKSDFFL